MQVTGGIGSDYSALALILQLCSSPQAALTALAGAAGHETATYESMHHHTIPKGQPVSLKVHR